MTKATVRPEAREARRAPSQRPGIPLRISMVRRQLIAGFSRRLRPLGLSPHQYFVLRSVHEGGAGPSQIAEKLLLDRPAVSKLLRSMRTPGWIASERSVDDARRDDLRLTPAGRELYGRAERLWTAYLNQVEAAFTSAELAEFDRLLAKLDEATRDPGMNDV